MTRLPHLTLEEEQRIAARLVAHWPGLIGGEAPAAAALVDLVQLIQRVARQAVASRPVALPTSALPVHQSKAPQHVHHH